MSSPNVVHRPGGSSSRSGRVDAGWRPLRGDRRSHPTTSSIPEAGHGVQGSDRLLEIFDHGLVITAAVGRQTDRHAIVLGLSDL